MSSLFTPLSSNCFFRLYDHPYESLASQRISTWPPHNGVLENNLSQSEERPRDEAEMMYLSPWAPLRDQRKTRRTVPPLAALVASALLIWPSWRGGAWRHDKVRLGQQPKFTQQWTDFLTRHQVQKYGRGKSAHSIVFRYF